MKFLKQISRFWNTVARAHFSLRIMFALLIYLQFLEWCTGEFSTMRRARASKLTHSLPALTYLCSSSHAHVGKDKDVCCDLCGSLASHHGCRSIASTVDGRRTFARCASSSSRYCRIDEEIRVLYLQKNSKESQFNATSKINLETVSLQLHQPHHAESRREKKRRKAAR